MIRPVDGHSLNDLTPREREVLALVAQGLPNKTIAARLNIALNTVKRHVSWTLCKWQADNRTEAAVMFVQLMKLAAGDGPIATD